MAEDDIYGSKKRYESFKIGLDSLVKAPTNKRKRKYFCKNIENLQYFRDLFVFFESKDLSYIRRLRLLQTMKFVVHQTNKNLVECSRQDINLFLAAMHNTYNSPKSKETFIMDIKYIWRTLFPEKDEKGRPDETINPYPVRHLSSKIDRSRQKRRKDKLTWDEFEKIVNYFCNEPRIQAYLTVSLESLARPQELLYVRIGDVELFNNYAKIYISEHGKEGIGLLQCIDSYPYLLKWYEVHPLKHDKKAFLFINIGYPNNLEQLKPKNINKMIRYACNKLGINKPITCYSLKRNGVTMRRLRGESDMEIQHAARWTSTNQLKTYDLSSQDEAFRLALEKRGIIKAVRKVDELIKAKSCPFCKATIGFGEKICPQCKHIVDRDTILEEKNKDEEIVRLRQSLANMDNQFADIKEQIMSEIMQQIGKTRESQDSFEGL